METLTFPIPIGRYGLLHLTRPNRTSITSGKAVFARAKDLGQDLENILEPKTEYATLPNRHLALQTSSLYHFVVAPLISKWTTLFTPSPGPSRDGLSTR